MSIVDTAKDWQDTLQTKLPGYAERIVEIRLEKNEGGMNLKMPPAMIERLAGYGRDAGRRLVEDFDFNEHRWRRALSFMSKLEEELASLADSYAKPAPGGKHSEYSLRDVLLDYRAKSYENPSQWRLNVLSAFVEKLNVMGEDAARAMQDPKRKCVREGNVPHIDARIRLIADADRVPAGSGGGEAD
ncbi:hypothetical protein [Rhizobium sp. RCC_161_2]|uniref:hypothetical protein n=1 Tax=Rhizobium sp. RCC_161_2 TaxID=3239219 RepID=UPI003523655C